MNARHHRKYLVARMTADVWIPLPGSPCTWSEALIMLHDIARNITGTPGYTRQTRPTRTRLAIIDDHHRIHATLTLRSHPSTPLTLRDRHHVPELHPTEDSDD